MDVVGAFSLIERSVFYFFVSILCVTSAALLWQVNSLFLVEVPDYGGTLTEGVIGAPRFVNPLLAISESDRDLTILLYSGLLRAQSDGSLAPDLASSYTISPDGLTYTFVLKDDLTFHDGTPVTADDVLFTIEKVQDPNLKSPRKTNWDGVRTEKIDERTVQFTLAEAYSPFIHNTTLGILPKHIWKSATNEEFPFSQFNTKPIGSGPYQIDGVSYTESGFPKEYTLTAFADYSLGKPYLERIVIKTYQDFSSLMEAYRKEDIHSMYGISPSDAATLELKNGIITLAPLPRVFGVFFNQNSAPVLLNKEVRQALDTAIDKQEIVDNVILGFGQSADEPLPPRTLLSATATASSSVSTDSAETENATTTTRAENAQAILVKAGWKLNDSGIFEKKGAKETQTLSFSISTGDAPELKAAAEVIQRQWQSIGAQVSVKIFESNDLNQNIIRPRKYDSLLFGEVVGRGGDLYPFWHSTERTDPGLNIALYTNIKADKALEGLRTAADLSEQEAMYGKLKEEIDADRPAVFLYAPYFIYVVPQKVKSITMGQLNTPAERFSNIHEWYMNTNKVWKIFTKNNQ